MARYCFTRLILICHSHWPLFIMRTGSALVSLEYDCLIYIRIHRSIGYNSTMAARVRLAPLRFGSHHQGCQLVLSVEQVPLKFRSRTLRLLGSRCRPPRPDHCFVNWHNIRKLYHSSLVDVFEVAPPHFCSESRTLTRVTLNASPSITERPHHVI